MKGKKISTETEEEAKESIRKIEKLEKEIDEELAS